MQKNKNIIVKQVKSSIAVPKKIKVILQSMGLKKIGQIKSFKDNNCLRGMINKVSHLVSYEIK